MLRLELQAFFSAPETDLHTIYLSWSAPKFPLKLQLLGLDTTTRFKSHAYK